MTTTVTATPTTAPVVKHPALGPFHDRREMALGWVLAGLAGATGAAAWLFTSGWYVTFMTGNTQRVVLENIQGHPGLALTAAATIGAFVLGVVVATLARSFLWRRARHGATLLMTAAAVVAWASDVLVVDDDAHIGAFPVLCLAFGLGALNTSITRRGEVAMPLSYVTGTLVKIGQGAALHLAGASRWAWVSHLSVYLAFLAGAGLGGTVFAQLGTENALLLLVVGSTAVSMVTWRLDHPRFLTADGS